MMCFSGEVTLFFYGEKKGCRLCNSMVPKNLIALLLPWGCAYVPDPPRSAWIAATGLKDARRAPQLVLKTYYFLVNRGHFTVPTRVTKKVLGRFLKRPQDFESSKNSELIRIVLPKMDGGSCFGLSDCTFSESIICWYGCRRFSLPRIA